MIGTLNVFSMWGAIGAVYFTVAYVHILRKSGVNLWKVWWNTRGNNIKTERRFAEEIRSFPVLNAVYQVYKWSTLVVLLGTFVYIFLTL